MLKCSLQPLCVSVPLYLELFSQNDELNSLLIICGFESIHITASNSITMDYSQILSILIVS